MAVNFAPQLRILKLVRLEQNSSIKKRRAMCMLGLWSKPFICILYMLISVVLLFTIGERWSN